MTAAFWSRFNQLLLSGTSGRTARPGSWGERRCRKVSRAGATAGRSPRGALRRRRLRLDQVARARRVDLDARPLRGGHDDGAQVLALRRGRLRADELLDDGLVVLEQLLVGERRLADRHVDDGGPVRAVLDLAGLGLLHGAPDVHRDRADLRVRHLALRAEDAAEAADHRHHVGRRDRDVEVREALVLDAVGEVFGAHEVGARLLGLTRLVAAREHRDPDLLAEAVRERDRAAQLLVGVADVEPGADVDLDALVELGALQVLDEADG